MEVGKDYHTDLYCRTSYNYCSLGAELGKKNSRLQ